MSALIFNGYSNSGGGGSRRKTQKHRSSGLHTAAAQRSAVQQADAQRWSFAVAGARRKKTIIELLSLALFALALHGVIIFAMLAGHRSVPIPVTPPRTPPIEIDIVKPKPLPQTLTPPPPPPAPRKLEPVAPKVARPSPPRPAPQQRNDALPVSAAVASAPTAAPAADSEPVKAAPAPAAVERVTQPRGDAAYLNNPAPKYPVTAQSRGWEGQVILNVHVLANGRPDSVDVASSSGRKTLDEAAVKAVTDWLFVPARRGQTAIDGWVQVPIDFKLGK